MRCARAGAVTGPCRRPRLRDDRGGVSLEFALVAPLFILLALASVVYGHYFAIRVAVVHAASEGARASVAGLSDSERASLAQQRVTEVIDAYSPLISEVAVSVNTPRPGVFEVTVTHGKPAIGFGAGDTLLPVPDKPSHTAIASFGGY